MSHRESPIRRYKTSNPRLGSGGGGGSRTPNDLAGYYALRNANWLAHLFQESSFAPREGDYKEFLSNAKTYLKNLSSFEPSNVSDLARLSLDDLNQYGDSYPILAERLRKRFETLPWRLLILPNGSTKPDSDLHDDVMRRRRIGGLRKALRGGLPNKESKPFRQKTWSIGPGTPLRNTLRDALNSFDRDAANKKQRTVTNSGDEQDRLLSSQALLSALGVRGSSYPCLILQLEASVGAVTCLEDVFPAFESALAEANRWPGVLIWKLDGQRSFFPLSSKIRDSLQAIKWILDKITSQPAMDVKALFGQYVERRFYPVTFMETEQLHIIHTSDLHLGHTQSNRRLTTIKNRIQQLAAGCRNSLVVPIITGDLMNSPNPKHLERVLDYLHFLDDLRLQRPVMVLGNHDVRRLGVLGKKTEEALRFYMTPVAWFERARVALLCFNSVRAGQLARGFIDETEFIALGNELDRFEDRAKHYMLLALVHHHPTPIEIPEWYVHRWYERWMGKLFEKTIELKNAETFLTWCASRGVAAILHGHKHIPRVELKDGIAIVGCGSTSGKVDTIVKGETYMAMNLINIDAHAGRLSCRVRVERVVGSGNATVESHEILYRNVSAFG